MILTDSKHSSRRTTALAKTSPSSCVQTCQFGALRLVDGAVRVDVEQCMGCGACVSQCAQGALSLRRDPSRGEPLEVERLIAAAGETP